MVLEQQKVGLELAFPSRRQMIVQGLEIEVLRVADA